MFISQTIVGYAYYCKLNQTKNFDVFITNIYFFFVNPTILCKCYVLLDSFYSVSTLKTSALTKFTYPVLTLKCERKQAKNTFQNRC